MPVLITVLCPEREPEGDCDPDLPVESIDGSMDPRPLHTLSRLVDLQVVTYRPGRSSLTITKWMLSAEAISVAIRLSLCRPACLTSNH